MIPNSKVNHINLFKENVAFTIDNTAEPTARAVTLTEVSLYV